MALTEVDKKFLIRLKNEGYSKEEAVAELKKVKLKVQSPTVSAVLPTISRAAGEVEAQKAIADQAAVAGRSTGIERPEGAVKEGVKTEDKPYYDASENLGDTNLLDVASTAGIEAGKTVVADLPANLINFVGDITGQEEIAGVVASPFEKAGEVVEGALRSSPTYEPSGETAGEVLGGIASAVIPAGQGAKLGQKLGGVGKLGFIGSSIGGTTGATAAMTGELPTSEEAGFGLAADVVLQSILKSPVAVKYVKDKVFTKALDKNLDDVIEIGKSKGIPEAELRDITKVVKENPALVDDLVQKTKALEKQGTFTDYQGATKLPDAFDVVGEKISTAKTKLVGGETAKGSKLAEIGEQIGEQVDALPKTKKTISTKGLYENFKKELETTFNIKGFDKQGMPVFEGSSIADNPADKKIINAIMKDLMPQMSKNGKVIQYKTYDPRTILAKAQNIEGLLYGPKGLEVNQAKGLALNVPQQYRDMIGELSPKLAELNTQYSELKNLQLKLNQKLKKDGVKSPELAKLLWGSSDSEYTQLVAEMQKLAKKYGVEEGKYIIPETAVATTIAKAGPPPKTGLSSGVAQGEQLAQAIASPKSTTVQMAMNKAGQVLDNIRGLPQSKMDAIELLIETAKKAEVTPQLIEDATKLAEFAKNLKDPNVLKAIRATLQSMLFGEDT